MKKVQHIKLGLEEGTTKIETDVPAFITGDIETMATNLAIVNLDFLKEVLAGLSSAPLSTLKERLHDVIHDKDTFKDLDEGIEKLMEFQRKIRAIEEYKVEDGGLAYDPDADDLH